MMNLASQEVPDTGVVLDYDNTQVRAFGLWDSAKHLLWGVNNDRVPALVTAGGGLLFI